MDRIVNDLVILFCNTCEMDLIELFLSEELMHIPRDTRVPFEWVGKWK